MTDHSKSGVPEENRASVDIQRVYLVRCGLCGFISTPDLGSCAKCGYDGGFKPEEPQNEGTEWIRVAHYEEKLREVEAERDETQRRLNVLRHTTCARLCQERDAALKSMHEEEETRAGTEDELRRAEALLEEARGEITTAWHAQVFGTRPLHECLHMTEDEYAQWVTPDPQNSGEAAACTCVGEREEAPPEPDPDCPIHGSGVGERDCECGGSGEVLDWAAGYPGTDHPPTEHWIPCPNCTGKQPVPGDGEPRSKAEAQRLHERASHSASESFERCPDPACQVNANAFRLPGDGEGSGVEELRPASVAHLKLVAAVLECLEKGVYPETIRRFVEEALPPQPAVSEVPGEVLPGDSGAEGILTDLIERVERDRREPDKLLCHLQSARGALQRLESGDSGGVEEEGLTFTFSREAVMGFLGYGHPHSATWFCEICFAFEKAIGVKAKPNPEQAIMLSYEEAAETLRGDAAMHALYCHAPGLDSDNDGGPTPEEEAQLRPALDALAELFYPTQQQEQGGR
jgi:hypothetical protein